MFVVMTRVPLKPGSIEACAALFERTNPGLVQNEQDWTGAEMLFDPDTNTVTVLARWRDAASYAKFSSTPEFRAAMGAFAAFFAGPPEISVNTRLVEMQAG